MSKFKVGDRVRNRYNDNDNGEILELYIKNGKDKAVVRGDDGRYGNYLCSRLQLLTELPITVYAVCDDSNGLLPVRVFMFEDNAREYARLNSPQGYSIRPFALTPLQ